MRVYLPCTLTGLAEVRAGGELGPAPLTGYAVTPALIEWYASGDTEELEYVALTDAARASLRMLAGDPAAGYRRVVIAAEVPDDAVTMGIDLEDRGRVTVAVPVPLAKMAAVHIDDLAAADAGDPDARFVLDTPEGHELLWYATQEIPDLLG